LKSRQHILIAPLNWGLGHATRCIPIIDALLERGFKISLASDGRALALLKKEYPDLATFELPGYEVRYFGNSMTFKKSTLKKEYDVIAVLSGPEPQRSILEEKIITQLQQVNIKALIVQGKTETLEQREINHQIKIVSFLTSRALNEAILKSEIVIARSGYSTIMDLVALGKKAILIPTPGQTEQEYLAKRLMKQQRFYFQQQDALDLKTALEQADKFIPCTLDSTRQNLLEEVLNKL